MARSRRIVFDNAVFHVLNRGHDRGKLFRSPEDFKYFKMVISKYKEKYPFDLYHYCLMSNHFHLLFKITKGEDLPHLMKAISQAYAFYYKKRYCLSGYLFQNRYKSIAIAKDEYLLECGRYIERNPVRAGIADNPSYYYWSSYNFYAKGKMDSIVTADPLFLASSAVEKERQNRYVEYVTIPRAYEVLIDEKIAELR